jgi:hypothetical protein
MGELPPLIALNDLKAKFSEFDKIAAITRHLNQNLELINEANRAAAGDPNKDVVASKYHEHVDKPTNGLVTLVDSIQTMYGITGDSGHEVANGFDNADHNAQDAARHW